MSISSGGYPRTALLACRRIRNAFDGKKLGSTSQAVRVTIQRGFRLVGR